MFATYLLYTCSSVPYISGKGSSSQDVVLYIYPNFVTHTSYLYVQAVASKVQFSPADHIKCFHYVTSINKHIFYTLFLLGQDDYDRLRPLSYQEANLVLVCFDVTNPTSFENVLIKVIAALTTCQVMHAGTKRQESHYLPGLTRFAVQI